MTKTTKTKALRIDNRDHANETLAVTAALDALEAGDPRAAELLVGVPCTVGIGSDRYAGEIVKVSASLHTIEIKYRGDEALKTFRYSAKRGGYMSGRCYYLAIGFASDYRDPSF